MYNHLSRFCRRKRRAACRLQIELLEDRCLPSTYYVSSQGNDQNPGTSLDAPWQTIGKVDSATFQPGDSVLFQGGQTFAGSLTVGRQDSRTSNSPVTFGSYGSGRAIISSGTAPGLTGTSGIQGFSIRDLVFVGSGAQSNTGDGILLIGSGNVAALSDYIRIDDVDVSGYYRDGIHLQTANGVQGGFNDVRITNAVAHDNRDSGILIEGELVPGTTAYSYSNVYVGYCTAYNNTGYTGKASGHGILMWDVNAGVIEYSVAHDNGYQCVNQGGPAGIWSYDSNNVLVQYCESYHNGTASSDGIGFDMDGGDTNCLIQYCYSHDNEGAGFLLNQNSTAVHVWNNNTYRFDISQNDGTLGSEGAVEIHNIMSDSTQMISAIVYDVTVYSPSTTALQVSGPGGSTNSIIANNIFYAANGKPVATDFVNNINMSLRGNDYFAPSGNLNLTWGGQLYTDLTSFSAGTGQEMVNGEVPVAVARWTTRQPCSPA
jgi:hypothetical protein